MFIIFAFFSLVFVILCVGLYQKNTNAICRSKKRLDGKTVIVTGGTSGIGLKAAIDFAERGARVIVACPYEDEGTRAREIIIEQSGNGDVIFKFLDLSSFKSIREFATDINKTEERLDILVNNAGVGYAGNEPTNDGLPFVMQVNYFGHFLLTLLLLPILRKTGTSNENTRIVNVASLLHVIGFVDFDAINSSKVLNSVFAYPNSKLCLILFTHKLAQELKGTNVIVNCLHPGSVGTTIFDSMGTVLSKFFTYGFTLFCKTPWEGAQTTLHVALDKKAGTVSGQYFTNCGIGRAKSSAYDDGKANKLWQLSLKLVGLDSDQVKALICDSNAI